MIRFLLRPFDLRDRACLACLPSERAAARPQECSSPTITYTMVALTVALSIAPGIASSRVHAPQRCRCAVRACADPATYAPFIDSMLALFEDAGVELEPYPLAEELRQREATAGGSSGRPVQLSTLSHCSTKLRHVRVAHIQGGPKLQVLNLCLFPRLEYTLPTFSADLVTLPAGHLIAIDCQPNDVDAPADADSGRLQRAYEVHRPRLPDGGPVSAETARFFSRHFLWSRLPSSCAPGELRELVLPAFEDYLSCYLQTLAEAEPTTDPAALQRVREGQLEYSDYRIRKDPARAMLTRLFGDEWTERLLQEALFDLPCVLGEGEGGRGVEA